MPKKPIKSIRSNLFARSLSLAKLGLQAGAQAASHSLGEVFSETAGKELRKHSLLISQLGLFAKEVGKLKGSVMKAGQMLSMYGEHFLPPEANQLLKMLQFNSPPLEWPEIQKVLNRQLGVEKMAELEIEEIPLAAASLGQVHRARLKKTGQEIVLKIQYPGVDKAIDGDIKTLKTILTLSKVLPQIPNTDVLFDEIKLMLRQELDYRQEFTMLEKFQELLKNDCHLIVPTPIAAHSSKRVLAMSYEPGFMVDSNEVGALNQERRNKLAEVTLDLYFRELYLYHTVQTDPHFGNYRIQIDRAGKQDKIVLYDYGAVRTFPKSFMEMHKKLLKSAILEDRSSFVKAALALKMLEPNDPLRLQEVFFELCSMIVEPFGQKQPYIWGDKSLPKRTADKSIEMIREFKLRAPPRELIFLDRKMVGMYTFVSELKAQINAREILFRYIS